MSTREGLERIEKYINDGYFYLGGEPNQSNMTPYNQWTRRCRSMHPPRDPRNHPAKHKNKCECDQEIYFNCWVGKKLPDGKIKVKVVGSECIDKFTLERQVCNSCGKPHRNLKRNFCDECKNNHCIDCNKETKGYTRCFSCNKKHRGS